MYISRLRKEKFLNHVGNCQKNMSDHKECLVASSRSSGQLERKNGDQTSNANDVVRTAGGRLQMLPTSNVKTKISMQYSVMYCGVLDSVGQLHIVCTAFTRL